MSPEEKTRLLIDKKLAEAGWTVQDKKDMNLLAAKGVAVREFDTASGDEVDYALFIDGEPVGIIEAKKDDEGKNLAAVADTQLERYYADGLKGSGEEYGPRKLRFLYAATSELIYFIDKKDPEPRSREVFSFPRPETLRLLMTKFERGNFRGKTMRGHLKLLADQPLNESAYRKCQIEAIRNLEQKCFKANAPRALISMATGAGKTYTAITSIYRLLKYGGVRRVLFLVDTRSLGAQAESEFLKFEITDGGKICKFADDYNISRIQSNFISGETNVCISTIQRLYSMLTGEIENVSDGIDEESLFDDKNKREVVYNADYPPEFFDVIFIDECHRSIYNNWKAVLDYFDAFQVGMSATPDDRTLGYFNRNLVSEYSHEQACADGVNVPCLGTYIIETEKSKNGGTVKPEDGRIEVRDKRTRKKRYCDAAEEETYDPKELNRKVINEDQIRIVISTIKEEWNKWELFRDREQLPKTLIFAIDDSHADDIVRITREVFNKGNEFCKKITYRSETDETDNNSGSKRKADEELLLAQFRNSALPRVAVTVNKIATGTDVKPLEILVFMRDVRSENLYEQMHGRGRRTVSLDELLQATGDAKHKKLGYVVVDAVGVSKSPKKKNHNGRKPNTNVSFKQLIASVITNSTSEETFADLAARLTNLRNVLDDKELDEVKKLNNGSPLENVISGLQQAHNAEAVAKDTLKLATDEKIINVATVKECLKKAVDGQDIDDAEKERQKAEIDKRNISSDNITEQLTDDEITTVVENGIDETDRTSLKKQVIKTRCRNAVKALHNEKLRNYLIDVRKATDQTIDPALDSIISKGFSGDIDASHEKVRTTLSEYIRNEENRDRLAALSILYSGSKAQQRITEAMVRELYEALQKHNAMLTKQNIFNAYEEFCKTDTASGKTSLLKQTMDIVSIIRYEFADEKPKNIVPFDAEVRRRYKEWIFAQNKNKGGKREKENAIFSAEQVRWLERIRDFIAQNGEICFADLDMTMFKDLGNSYDFEDLFADPDDIINDLNSALLIA